MAAPLPRSILPAGPYVAVGHGCSDLARERQLTPEEWKRLLRPIVLAGHEILFVGGPGDATSAAAIIAELGRGRNLCGQLGIRQSAKVIGRAASFYGIDSMPLHLARGLGVPTIAVFGPTDPAILLRPLGLPERIAFARLPCSPCIHVHESPPCGGQRTCMALALTKAIEVPDPSPVPAPAAESHAVGWGAAPRGPAVHEVFVTSH
jgi:ADP-heptose:LPS heptosyltransferase